MTDASADMTVTLGDLLFNAGVAAAQDGALDEASAAFEAAAQISGDRCEFCVAASKSCFAVGRFDDAMLYLEAGIAAGAPREQAAAMRRAIERAQTIAADVRQEQAAPADPLCKPQFRGAWIISFCDWLENIVYEFCHDLREEVSRRR